MHRREVLIGRRLEAIQMLRGESPTYSFLQLEYNVGGMTFIEGSSKSVSSFSKY